jgi:hypothetical protein
VSLSDRVAALTTRVAQEVKAIRALRSVANGLAALDATGKLPVDQLPAVITAATRLQVLSTADISLTGTTSPFAIGVEQSGQQIIADNNEVFVRTWNATTGTYGTGITIKTAGVWLFIVHSQWGAPASNTERCTWLVKNASNNAGAGMAQDSRPGTFGTSGQTIMAADRCVVNDVIRAGVYQNHGATIAWCPTNKPSRFFAFWLGP